MASSRAARFLIPPLLILAALSLSACDSREPDAKPGRIQTSVQSLRLDASSGGEASAEVGVAAPGSVQFTATVSESWLTVTPAAGTTPATLAVRAAAPAESGERKAKLEIKPVGGGAVTIVEVTLAVRAPGTPAPTPTPKAGPVARNDGGESLPPEVRERVKAATVFILSRYRPQDKYYPTDDDLETASGSGFVVASEGLIATNRHVVDSVSVDYQPPSGPLDHPAERHRFRRVLLLHDVRVFVNSGTGTMREYPAQVIGTRDDPADLALIRIRPEGGLLPALELCDEKVSRASGAVEEQQPVWAFGFPLGEKISRLLKSIQFKTNPLGPEISIREGRITSLRRDGDRNVETLEMSCNIEPGNSGGPLVDRAGRVVGVNTWGVDRTNFALPVSYLHREFGHTIRARSESHTRTLIRVEASGTGPGGKPLLKLAEALKSARSGDTVEVPAGEFEVTEPSELPGGVWLRGAGREKTKVLVRRAMKYDQWRRDLHPLRPAVLLIRTAYAEVSDLHIDGGFKGDEINLLSPAIEVRSSVAGENLVRTVDTRDTRIETASDGVLTGSDLNAAISTYGRTRLEHSRVYHVDFRAGQSVIRGSRVSPSRANNPSQGNLDAAFDGCSFESSLDGESIVPRLAKDASGTARFRHCLFNSQLEVADRYGDGTRWAVEITESRVRGTLIFGRGVRVRLDRCLLEHDVRTRATGYTSAYVKAEVNARVELTLSLFLCDNLTPDWARSLSDRIISPARDIVWAVYVSGAEAAVSLDRNYFICRDDPKRVVREHRALVSPVAVGLSGGAKVTNNGGNNFTGYGEFMREVK